MVCCCYVFTFAANAQSPPADTTAKKSAVDSAITTPSDSAVITPKNRDRKKISKKKAAKLASLEAKMADLTNTSMKNAGDSSGYATRSGAKDSSEISKIEDCEIPFEMAYRIKHMSPNELDSMRIVFQKVVKEGDEGEEEEKIITIKMRYANDHITGYMTKAPIHHSNKYVVVNMPINVKVEWCCTPDSTHPKHCAATLAEVKHFDSTEHCTRWNQMDDGTDMMKQVAEKKTKYKNLQKPKRLFGRILEFVTFRRKKYILIPIDRTFEELLKPPVAGQPNTPSHHKPAKF